MSASAWPGLLLCASVQKDAILVGALAVVLEEAAGTSRQGETTRWHRDSEQPVACMWRAVWAGGASAGKRVGWAGDAQTLRHAGRVVHVEEVAVIAALAQPSQPVLAHHAVPAWVGRLVARRRLLGGLDAEHLVEVEIVILDHVHAVLYGLTAHAGGGSEAWCVCSRPGAGQKKKSGGKETRPIFCI